MITRIWVLSWVCYCNAIARRPHIYSASRLRHPGICCTGLAWHHLTTIWLASFKDIHRKAITNIGSQHPVAQGLSVRMFERLHWRKRAGSTWREITWPMRNLRHYREALETICIHLLCALKCLVPASEFFGYTMKRMSCCVNSNARTSISTYLYTIYIIYLYIRVNILSQFTRFNLWYLCGRIQIFCAV